MSSIVSHEETRLVSGGSSEGDQSCLIEAVRLPIGRDFLLGRAMPGITKQHDTLLGRGTPLTDPAHGLDMEPIGDHNATSYE